MFRPQGAYLDHDGDGANRDFEGGGAIFIFFLSENLFFGLILCICPFLPSPLNTTMLASGQRVRGGTHGQILLRACTVYISDSEPDKSGSLPESSRTNPTPDNFVFHTYNRIKYKLKHFFQQIFDHSYLYFYV